MEAKSRVTEILSELEIVTAPRRTEQLLELAYPELDATTNRPGRIVKR